MAKSLQVSKLEEILQKELNTTKVKHLGFATGGCISEGQSYLTENGRIFVKVNEKSGVNLTYQVDANLLRYVMSNSPLVK